MSKQADEPGSARGARTATDYARLHARFGWWSLLVFLALGVLLEAFHALKTGWYMDVSNETRRLMWTLAHTHGTLFALVHVVFGLGLRSSPVTATGWLRVTSPCLIGATLLLPGGFLLGGSVIHAGDPGVGILLVPVGALLVLVGVFLAARNLS